MDWCDMERILNDWLGFVVVWLLVIAGLAGFLWR